MMRRLHFAFFIALIALGAVPLMGAAPGSISGVVRNTAGVPQIGAVVQLLRPDLSILAIVYTDDRGQFSIPSILPGRYAVKAMGTSFLPSLRENIHVRRDTVVNLTLSTLYEVMQWLPAQPRAANAQKDDWAWTDISFAKWRVTVNRRLKEVYLITVIDAGIDDKRSECKGRGDREKRCERQRQRDPDDRSSECERRNQRQGRLCAVSSPAGLLRQALEHAQGEVQGFFGQGACGGGSPPVAGHAARD